MKITSKTEDQLKTQEERLGFFQISCMAALIAMAQDGADRHILMEMLEEVQSLNSTIWSSLALCSIGKPTPETDAMIQTLDAQLDNTFAEIKQNIMRLNELRKTHALKKAKTTND